MDAEILATERAHHRRLRRIHRTAMGVLFAVALAALIWVAFDSSMRNGIIITVSIVVIVAAIFIIDARTRITRPGSLVTSGPWSFGQVYTSMPDQRRIWNSMGKVITANSMKFSRVGDTTGLCERPGTILSRKGTHLIDVQKSADHPGWFVVTVFSAPDLSTTLTDFGRGATINHDLLTAVPNHVRPDEVAS